MYVLLCQPQSLQERLLLARTASVSNRQSVELVHCGHALPVAANCQALL